MLAAWQIDLTRIFLVILLLVACPSSSAASQKATNFGSATANSYAGAGVKPALKTILEDGDRLSAEQPIGDWYRVTADDWKNGYVGRNLPQLAANVTPQPAPGKISSPEAKESSEGTIPAAVPAAGTASPTKELPKPPAAPTPVGRVEQPQDPEAKSQSILQMIEGHESEVKYGLIIAAAAFLLGWLCGGAFYARRAHRSRHKLRF